MESVLQKLFPAKRRKPSKQFGFNFCRKSRQTPAVIEIPSKESEKERQEVAIFVSVPPPDVRLVLFRECGETSDRKLLFDSKSFEPEKADQEEPQYFSTVSAQHGVINNNSSKSHSVRPLSCYQYVRGPQDSEILSEMLFGTVGMASRASSLKIHIRKEEGQLMLSRVFCVESTKETVSLDRGMEHLRPPNPVLSRRKAKTLPVPTPEPPYIPPPAPISLASSLTSRITRSDSSSSLMSLTSILGASLSATGSLGSRSTPLPTPSSRAHSLPPATRQASRDSFTLTQEPHSGVMPRKTKVKIGFAVIFQPEPTNSSEFQRFFFEHFPLIESYVTYLKEQVESALNNNYRRKNTEFVEVMMEALHIFTMRVTSIYSTPRLPKPVWTTLTSVSSQKIPWLGDRITVECFIGDLTRMVAQHNTKQKNFFMSGLITSVLTHHLGWVNTALPPSGENETTLLGYNPLWAQLGDLYGAVGTPTKVAKTVVVGEIHELVSTIISILSYFIRCSKINEVVEIPKEVTPQAFLRDDSDEDLKMSLVPSELENDYVYVSHDGEEGISLVPKALVTNDHGAETKQPRPCKAEKPSRLSQLCRKLNPESKKNEQISTEAISCVKPPQDSQAQNGSALCRSRSSPGTVVKPQLRINRQKSSGNAEILPFVRNRTNSNDMFGMPRGVQSRRTSYDVTNVRRMSQSSSALVIPDSERVDFNTVSSLEGSKSLCMDPTPTYDTDLIRKRLGKENTASCPGSDVNKENVERDQRPLQSSVNKKKTDGITSFRGKNGLSAPKTHKRVSSEPFRVEKLGGNSLIKTNSIYFDSKNSPVVKPTFVGAIEPKVVRVAHVQRSPVVAMSSPRSSPYLPRSKSAVGQKGPIMGFKTSETGQLITRPPTGARTPQKVISKTDSTSSHEFKDVFSNGSEKSLNSTSSEHQKSKVESSDGSDLQRTPSSASTCGIVRRTSSNTSGKMRIAGRRRKLTGDSTRSESFGEREFAEESKNLPPLHRIPSVSLDHDNFAEYFDENDEAEGLFFNADTCSDFTSSDGPLPVNGDPKIGLTTPKASPPPLPSVGPCHSSRSIESVPEPAKVIESPSAKLPPPLPMAAPVHRGSLYPNLDADITPKNSPQTSLYPSLEGIGKTPCDLGSAPPSLEHRLYPRLDPVGCDVPDSARSRLYPVLPKADSEPMGHIGDAYHLTPVDSNARKAGSITDEANFFAGREEVPLTQIKYNEKPAQQTLSDDDDKPGQLTFAELVADYSPEYLWGFALHGTHNQSGLYSNIIRELQHAVNRPVLDEPVAEAVSIIADTDKWQVKVLSSHRIHSDNTALPALTSKLVTNILERITKLYQMRTPAAFCMQELENELGELVLKSRMLAGYVVGNTRVTVSQLSAALGIESSDLPLLMAIASCHSPEVSHTLHATL